MSNEQLARKFLAEQYSDDPTMQQKILSGTSMNEEVKRAVRAFASYLSTKSAVARAETETNATRYLYLRNNADPDSDSGLAVSFSRLSDFGKWYNEYPTGEYLDRMIDADMVAAITKPSGTQPQRHEQDVSLNAHLESLSEDPALDGWKPETSSTQPPAEAVAYLELGTGGYIDAGTYLSDSELAKLPKGMHMLGIIGTLGVDGYKTNTTTSPAIDIGKLRNILREYRDRHQHAIEDYTAWPVSMMPDWVLVHRRKVADADHMLALIGDGGEKGNG